MCEALTAGLSIVFTRMAVSRVTKIRPHQVENPEICQQTLGVDSNFLYLASISRKCPTGIFCVYSEKKQFFSRPLFQVWVIISAMAKLHLCSKTHFHQT